MKHGLSVAALALVVACTTPTNWPAQTYANDAFGFTFQVPDILRLDPTAEQAGGDVLRSPDGSITAVLWGGNTPPEGIAAFARAEAGRLGGAGLIVTYQDVRADGFDIWAVSLGSQVLIQSSQVGTDCAGQPILASFLYGFDRNTTPGELRLATTDADFPSFQFGANCP